MNFLNKNEWDERVENEEIRSERRGGIVPLTELVPNSGTSKERDSGRVRNESTVGLRKNFIGTESYTMLV